VRREEEVKVNQHMRATPPSSRWFFQPKLLPQPKLRLFCFPYAGGSASTYSSWSKAVSAEVEIWPIQLPGRQNRLSEPPLAQIAAMVQELTSPLQDYLDIPFAFFGHCMGAHLCFELTRQLRSQGAPLPEHLFVAARRAPQLLDPNTHCHQLSDPIFLKAVSNLNGLPGEFVENKELVRLMMPTLRADFKAAETYTYTHEEPLDCAISAFGGTEDYSVTTNELVAWHHQTTGMFRFHHFPGDHFFIHSHQASLLKTIFHEIAQIIEKVH
jgi:medium-chain acyl-[acyl-carrier-protein] hydrolase